MPIYYTVPMPSIPPPPVVDRTDPNGEDVSLRGGEMAITTGGDWGVLTGPLVARQSVEREAISSPGDMPRRPTWGMGLRDMLMRGITRDARDRAAATTRRRLRANPRIDEVRDVTVVERTDLPDVQGVVTVTIDATIAGQKVRFGTDVRPRGGR